jgi:XTP/dITP diphosphohydrolase
MEIVLATHNQGKVREFGQILSQFLPDVILLSLEDMGIPSPLQENGNTLKENAVEKAVWVYRQTGKPTLSDDSGLEVDALGGAPGVYSARFAGPEATAAANNNKLLQCLLGVANRRARFRTVLCLAEASGHRTWDGVLEGEISTVLRGSKGFGYDPLFIPYGTIRTLAELEEEEKNRISHRRMALSKIAKKLVEEI